MFQVGRVCRGPVKTWMSVCQFLIYISFNVTIFVLSDCRVQRVDFAFRYLIREVYRRCCIMIIYVAYEFSKTVCISFPNQKYVVNKLYQVQYVKTSQENEGLVMNYD